MNSDQIRERFLNFFVKHGHKIVPSSSLIPSNDSSVLFTTAGMQQFKPYYSGLKNAEVDFGSRNVVSVQKCVRTSDIDEVGDERHLTFFEMLGNFSFGGYWKEEAIKYAYEFITQELKLKIDYVSVFAGEGNIPADLDSEKIWQSLDPNLVIKNFGRADNFWGPTGEEGPCGPTTEIYVDGIEIWNIVFNQYYQEKDKTLKPLETPGIDTGMGLERLAMVCQGKNNVFETDLLAPAMSKIEELSAVSNLRARRVLADHLRAAVFLIADGITPANTERGYILRRLLRRAVRYADLLEMKAGALAEIAGIVSREEIIRNEINNEESKFRTTLARGLKEFEKISGETISGQDAFTLFSTYGFPFELTQELAGDKNLTVDEAGFKLEMEKHQQISRAGAEQKFRGGLAGTGEMETKYHTATHLLHRALREVLGNHVEQKGSNITAERLRFDFSHPQKMSDEEKKKVEEIVNQKIAENLPVKQIILSRAEAEKTGALHFFADKYGDEVSIYYIGSDLDSAYSKEFCGGPHVSNTSELGHFKIVKEEAVAAGIRRIKATLG